MKNRECRKTEVFYDDDGEAWVQVGSPFRFDYNVSLKRIRTERELLGWVYHLLEKNGMETKTVYDFIKCVRHAKGWEQPGL